MNRWDDDIVFKNQARDEPELKKKFVNDTVRSDFHRKVCQETYIIYMLRVLGCFYIFVFTFSVSSAVHVKVYSLDADFKLVGRSSPSFIHKLIKLYLHSKYNILLILKQIQVKSWQSSNFGYLWHIIIMT